MKRESDQERGAVFGRTIGGSPGLAVDPFGLRFPDEGCAEILNRGAGRMRARSTTWWERSPSLSDLGASFPTAHPVALSEPRSQVHVVNAPPNPAETQRIPPGTNLLLTGRLNSTNGFVCMEPLA